MTICIFKEKHVSELTKILEKIAVLIRIHV